jgi:hypothetical protein
VATDHLGGALFFGAKQRQCADCGTLFDGTGFRCERCLNRKYYEGALDQQAGIFRESPDLAVLVTRRGSPQLAHLALVGHASVAWCGMFLKPRASQHWLRVGPGEPFRPNTCPKCLEIFSKVTGRRVGIIKEARV